MKSLNRPLFVFPSISRAVQIACHQASQRFHDGSECEHRVQRFASQPCACLATVLLVILSFIGRRCRVSRRLIPGCLVRLVSALISSLSVFYAWGTRMYVARRGDRGRGSERLQEPFICWIHLAMNRCAQADFVEANVGACPAVAGIC